MLAHVDCCCLQWSCGLAPGVDRGDSSNVRSGWSGVLCGVASGSAVGTCVAVLCGSVRSLGVSLGVSDGDESAGLWRSERPAAMVDEMLVPNMDGDSMWDCSSLRAEISRDSSRLAYVEPLQDVAVFLISNTGHLSSARVAPILPGLLFSCRHRCLFRESGVRLCTEV